MPRTTVLSICISVVLGECQNPAPVKFFDRKEFSGSWRIHTVVGNPILGPVPSCYALKFTGTQRYNVSVSYKDGDQIKSITGVETSGDHGVFVIKINGIDANMVVLDTDYSTYHTSYLCNKADPSHRSVLVALRSQERNEQLIKDQISKAQKVVNVTESRYDSDQKSCSNEVPFKKWQVRGNEESQIFEKATQEEFKIQFGLIVTRTNPRYGTANDGNTVRRFFSDCEIGSQIIKIDKTFYRYILSHFNY